MSYQQVVVNLSSLQIQNVTIQNTNAHKQTERLLFKKEAYMKTRTEINVSSHDAIKSEGVVFNITSQNQLQNLHLQYRRCFAFFLQISSQYSNPIGPRSGSTKLYQ